MMNAYPFERRNGEYRFYDFTLLEFTMFSGLSLREKEKFIKKVQKQLVSISDLAFGIKAIDERKGHVSYFDIDFDITMVDSEGKRLYRFYEVCGIRVRTYESKYNAKQIGYDEIGEFRSSMTCNIKHFTIA